MKPEIRELKALPLSDTFPPTRPHFLTVPLPLGIISFQTTTTMLFYTHAPSLKLFSFSTSLAQSLYDHPVPELRFLINRNVWDSREELSRCRQNSLQKVIPCRTQWPGTGGEISVNGSQRCIFTDSVPLGKLFCHWWLVSDYNDIGTVWSYENYGRFILIKLLIPGKILCRYL